MNLTARDPGERILLFCLGACLLVFGPRVRAQDPETPPPSSRARAGREAGARAGPGRRLGAEGGLDRDVERAVQRGLAYLARHQHEEGYWTDRVGRKILSGYRGTEKPHVGVTALAGIAFLSGGTLPGQGPGKYVGRRGRTVYGFEIVQRALDYVIRNTTSTGFITAHGSRMYSHAFATLFLAEAYGMGFARDGGDLKRSLKRSVAMIINAQHKKEGGWRYLPQAEDSDMSVTVCQVMALRAARNAGLAVPRETIQAAVRYVKKSYIQGVGSFTYQLDESGLAGLRSRDTYPLTAAGLATLYNAGEYSGVEIQYAIRYINTWKFERSYARRSFDYYYGHYYAVQAMFQRGGAVWRSWYNGYVKPDLLALQEPEGCWTDLVGPNYATAMATIVLQFPNQYLPITEH